MTGRPLLLVDVPGVLNPYQAPGCPHGFAEHALFPEEIELVRVCRAHGGWLLKLAHTFELASASSWEDAANQKLAPLLGTARPALRALPPAPFPSAENVSAIAACANDRPTAWLDDQLTDEAFAWAEPAGALLQHCSSP